MLTVPFFGTVNEIPPPTERRSKMSENEINDETCMSTPREKKAREDELFIVEEFEIEEMAIDGICGVY